MHRSHVINPTKTLLLAALCTTSFMAWANPVCPGIDSQASPKHELFVSPYTHHWRHSDEHKHVALVGIKRHLPDHRLCGFSVFSNSFGQPSAYAFTGWHWPRIFDSDRLYSTVTAGIMYGYVGKYKNKVPLNYKGFSPAVIPAVGLRLTPQLSAEMHVLGTAGLMFGVNSQF